MPGTSTEPVVDKGIRQKSIHSFHSIHSFPDGSAFCPGAPKRVPSDSEKHRRVYTSSNVCHSHKWRVDTASGLTLKKQNACLHAVRHAVEKKSACIHGLQSEGVLKSEIMAPKSSKTGKKVQDFKRGYMMKWPFIMQSTRDSYHARCNTCGSNFSVAAGGANDIICSHWYNQHEAATNANKSYDFLGGLWSTGMCISKLAALH